MSDEELFDFFLNWLDSDRDLAEKKFADIWRRLVMTLELRGCTPAEDLASDALYRFVRRLPSIAQDTVEPIPYLYTVARNLYIDLLDEQFLPLPDNLSELPQPDKASVEGKEELHKCLDHCLDKLEPGLRRIVLAYYRWDKSAKIKFHKRLAKVLGISVNALRIRVYRARIELQTCIEDCMGWTPAGNEMREQPLTIEKRQSASGLVHNDFEP